LSLEKRKECSKAIGAGNRIVDAGN